MHRLLQGLYIIVNIATGTEAHRSAFMNRHGLLKAILAHLVRLIELFRGALILMRLADWPLQNHPAPEVRVGAVWAVANLCPRPDNRRASGLMSMAFGAWPELTLAGKSLFLRQHRTTTLCACAPSASRPSSRRCAMIRAWMSGSVSGMLSNRALSRLIRYTTLGIARGLCRRRRAGALATLPLAEC